MKPTFDIENSIWDRGYKYIAGTDEAGRGPLVGPVVAAAVILPKTFNIEGVNDSKKLSEKKREELYNLIIENALCYSISIISEKIIDKINIYNASKKAMIDAITSLHIKPDYILSDAMKLDLSIPCDAIIKGDAKSITIAAASILAKVTRDRLMIELDSKYPMYNFKKNKGYPTKEHVNAISKHGIIKEHRRTYNPVKEYIEKK
ncbi:MAG TPA: ribonuclease HII [Bacilli bacterium]|nr:ribonuclease HII [Bacilli bacterium]